jgi:hypothetical protein
MTDDESPYRCWRALNIDHLCALNIDQGRVGAEYTAPVDKSMV